MAAVSSIIMGASAALSMYGASKQADALNAQADFSETMARINKRYAERQADDVLAKGEADAKTVSKQAGQALGSQRAALASQGVALDSGSALDIQLQTAEAGARDAARIKQNSQLEAWGIRTNSSAALSQARMQAGGMRNEARSTLLTGGLRAASDLARGYEGSNYRASKRSDQGADNAYANSRRYDR